MAKGKSPSSEYVKQLRKKKSGYHSNYRMFLILFRIVYACPGEIIKSNIGIISKRHLFSLYDFLCVININIKS